MLENKRKEYEAGIKWWEISEKHDYINRRAFIKNSASLSAGVLFSVMLPGFLSKVGAQSHTELNSFKFSSELQQRDFSNGEKINDLEQAITYNNFWEFGSGKRDPAKHAKNFVTDPWKISIEGLISKPGIIDTDFLISRYSSLIEERIYRLRCVEAWSMVIPWVGFPLHELIKDYEPFSKAKYIQFETFYDPNVMKRAAGSIDYPYVEGLRMDEALNDLTFVAIGMYGDKLHSPNGPPVRLIVPWKYGFKSIKSINKIVFMENQPLNTWQKAQPREYGFFSNVNPSRDHPRWSQKTERRIGQRGRRSTLMFNGYAKWVESLYQGMDLVNTFY